MLKLKVYFSSRLSKNIVCITIYFSLFPIGCDMVNGTCAGLGGAWLPITRESLVEFSMKESLAEEQRNSTTGRLL